MKTILYLIFFVAVMPNSNSQITAIWKGGKPGNPKDWDCPANWSNQRVPDSFTDVVIMSPGFAPTDYPIIQSPGVEVNSLCIYPTAYLTIAKKGSLKVLEPSLSHFHSQQIRLENGLNMPNAILLDSLYIFVRN